MDPDDVFDRLRLLLLERAREPAPSVRREHSLQALGLDSVDQATLMEQVEETFDLTIERDDVIHLDTVDALVRYVAARAAS